MKWLIVEDALRDRKGHWVEYVSTFVRELRALGDEVVVLCDHKAQGFVMEQTGARPVLPESIWHRMGDGAGVLKRYLRVPTHAVATFFAIRKFFKGFNHRGHREHRVGVDTQGEAQGNTQRTCAGAAFSNPFASKLARDSENTSPTRTANDPSAPGEYSSSVPIRDIRDIRDIRGSNFVTLDSGPSPLDSGEAPDWIFVPTVLVHHLLGWWLLCKSASVPRDSWLLLFFPNLPIWLDHEGQPHWTGGPTTKLMAWLFATLRNEVESGRVILGVETHAMRRALEALIRMPVVYLPHPVEAAQPPRTDSGRLRTEVEDQNIDSSNNPLSAICHPPSGYAKPIIFGCYGAARWEKGSDIFQEAIKLILKNEVAGIECPVASIQSESARELGSAFLPITSNSLPATPVARPLRFAIQWVEDFQDEKGNLVKLDPWLKKHPQVEVIDRYFRGDEYERQLERTDVMVLPYRSPYRLRVSRVVIEAMMHDMPVIATHGTTLFEQAEEFGEVVGCKDGNAESLARAILEGYTKFNDFHEFTELKNNVLKTHFSIANFKKIQISL